MIRSSVLFFFFNDTATTEIYTLSLHDALPISVGALSHRLRRPGHEPGARRRHLHARVRHGGPSRVAARRRSCHRGRSEEHTSELQSRSDLVCRLLLEKTKKPTFT